jgi:hypothetical protein
VAYIEFLRIRKSLMWHIGILALVAIGIMLLGAGHADTEVIVNGSSRSASQMVAGMTVPLSAAAGIAAFFGAIFASTCGTSFNRESMTRDISWTKPISRMMLALQFAIVDIAGVIVAYFAAFAVIVIVLLRYHVAPFFDDAFAVELALGIGIGTMWYGLLQLITCMLGSGARAMAGILWPIAFVLIPLKQLDNGVGVLARILDVINPLAYMSSTQSGSGRGIHVVASGSGLPSNEKLQLVWLFTVVFTGIAIAIWPKKEA